MTVNSAPVLRNVLSDHETLRRAATADTESPLISAKVDFAGPPEVSRMGFVVQCYDVPAWSQVAFSCPARNNGGPDFLPIALPWVSVPVPAGGKRGDLVKSFRTGMQTQVIANYKSGLYYQYRANGYLPPQTFKIVIQVLLITEEGSIVIGTDTMQLPDLN